MWPLKWPTKTNFVKIGNIVIKPPWLNGRATERGAEGPRFATKWVLITFDLKSRLGEWHEWVGEVIPSKEGDDAPFCAEK